MSNQRSKPRILRITLTVRETSAPYNQFCLPWIDEHDITLCTFFPSEITPAKTITLFEGDGSITGFLRVLRGAIEAKEYDIIHAHSPHVGFLFLAARLFNRHRLTPAIVITVHDSYQDFKLRNRLMFIPIFANFKRVICCGRSSFESFPSFYKHLAGDRLSFVPNGLDIARVDQTAANSRPQTMQGRGFTVIAISRLVDVKNPMTILTALQRSNDQTSRLVYLGEGPLHQSLITETVQMGLDHQVEFTGLVPREKVFQYLLNANLFISASRGEGLPVAVLEAMACRCPVLLSDIPPHREIAEGVDFIPLVQADDVDGFAREINRFSQMTISERAVIGQKCRALVEQRFSLTAMHSGYEKIYAQLTNPSRFSPIEMVG